VKDKDQQLRVNVSCDVIAKTPSIIGGEWRRSHPAKDPWILESARDALAVATPR
jgi:hypothetical protein